MTPVAKMGASPRDKDMEVVTVKKGIIYIGKYPALNFETGEPIKAKRTITYEEVYNLLYANGAVAKKMKVYRP